jgi:hypothetical protein
MKEYNGDIKGFPEEVVERMLYYQVEQGNKRDVTVFEKNRIAGKDTGGFDWVKTLEKHAFWIQVIDGRDFDVFFDRYPKKAYPKVMMVSDCPIDNDNKGIPQVVFMEKCGRFFAWASAKTIEEAEREIEIKRWSYVKDIEPQPTTIELTMDEIAEKFGVDVKILKIKK